MMLDLSLIHNRLREVRGLIDGHRLQIDSLEKEVAELEVAARVVARLTGAGGDQAGEEDASGEKTTGGGGKPEGAPTMPEMIRAVLEDADIIGDYEPKDVAQEIRRRWWPDVDGAYVSSIMWRMMKRGDLVKVPGTAYYRLPEKNEAADDDPTRDTSAASLFTLAEGPKTPGGGG